MERLTEREWDGNHPSLSFFSIFRLLQMGWLEREREGGGRRGRGGREKEREGAGY